MAPRAARRKFALGLHRGEPLIHELNLQPGRVGEPLREVQDDGGLLGELTGHVTGKTKQHPRHVTRFAELGQLPSQTLTVARVEHADRRCKRAIFVTQREARSNAARIDAKDSSTSGHHRPADNTLRPSPQSASPVLPRIFATNDALDPIAHTDHKPRGP